MRCAPDSDLLAAAAGGWCINMVQRDGAKRCAAGGRLAAAMAGGAGRQSYVGAAAVAAINRVTLYGRMAIRANAPRHDGGRSMRGGQLRYACGMSWRAHVGGGGGAGIVAGARCCGCS